MAITIRKLRSPGEFSREPIGKCSALLPNKMQCVKGASYMRTDDSTKPPTNTQLCRQHAVLQEQEDLKQAKLTETKTEQSENLENDNSSGITS